MKLPWRVIASILVAALGLHAGNAFCQSYPSKPIHIVVPFSAGGGTDSLARLIGPRLADALNQPVIVENRSGAGGIIGANVVAKAEPDGHTILITPDGLASAPAIYRKLPFDAANDFSPVTQLVATMYILAVNPKVLPVASVKELIALAKSKPGSLNYGSAGVTDTVQLTMVLLKILAGIDIVAIPYKGVAPLSAALIAGEVGLAMVPLEVNVLSTIKSGRLRALGVTRARRSAALPDIPTIEEAGVPGFAATGWQGLFAPARTPRGIVEKIQRETAKALNMPEVRDRISASGQELVGGTPEEFEAKFKADLAKYATIVKEARIPIQD